MYHRSAVFFCLVCMCTPVRWCAIDDSGMFSRGTNSCMGITAIGTSHRETSNESRNYPNMRVPIACGHAWLGSFLAKAAALPQCSKIRDHA